jgi:hypothetical protein
MRVVGKTHRHGCDQDLYRAVDASNVAGSLRTQENGINGAHQRRSESMPNFFNVLHDGSLLVGAATATYAATVAVTALSSVLARSLERRRDARSTPVVLLRRSRDRR